MTIGTLLFVFQTAALAEEDSNGTEKESGGQVSKLLDAWKETGIPINEPFAEFAAKTISEIAKQNRADQDTIYKAVRSINLSVESIDLCETGEEYCVKAEIYEIGRKLKALSERDEFIQSDWLSKRIKVRSGDLIADAAALNEDKSKEVIRSRARELVADYRRLETEYSQAYRFQAGLGFSYSYLPDVSFTG